MRTPVVIPLSERISLTLPEAAALTGLKVTLLREAVGCGLLRSTKIGKRRLIPRAALDAFLRKGERKPVRVCIAYRRYREGAHK